MPKINNKYLVNSMASNTDGAFIYFCGPIVSISRIFSFVIEWKTMRSFLLNVSTFSFIHNNTYFQSLGDFEHFCWANKPWQSAKLDIKYTFCNLQSGKTSKTTVLCMLSSETSMILINHHWLWVTNSIWVRDRLFHSLLSSPKALDSPPLPPQVVTKTASKNLCPDSCTPIWNF